MELVRIGVDTLTVEFNLDEVDALVDVLAQPVSHTPLQDGLWGFFKATRWLPLCLGNMPAPLPAAIYAEAAQRRWRFVPDAYDGVWVGLVPKEGESNK